MSEPPIQKAEPVRKASAAIVRFDDVSLYFGDTPGLDHVSFEMQAGETRVLFGAAGSGKTTLLKTALGLLKPDSGQVYSVRPGYYALKEQALFDMRARVGILFQEGGLFDSLNIAENVAYPLLNQRALQATLGTNGNAAKTMRRTGAGSFELRRTGQTLEKFPSELSGGMRRRVGIARAMVTAPRTAAL